LFKPIIAETISDSVTGHSDGEPNGDNPLITVWSSVSVSCTERARPQSDKPPTTERSLPSVINNQKVISKPRWRSHLMMKITDVISQGMHVWLCEDRYFSFTYTLRNQFVLRRLQINRQHDIVTWMSITRLVHEPRAQRCARTRFAICAIC